MNDGTAALFLAFMLIALAFLALTGTLVLSRRLGRAGRSLRDVDARLADEVSTMPMRWEARRQSLIETKAATERALWSLARFDERVDAAREALVERRAGLDRRRAQIVATRRGVERMKKGARMLIRAIELRRTFLA